MKYYLAFCLLFLASPLIAQKTNPFIVKSNVLNLIAKRPAISIEKVFSQTYAIEVSAVWGETSSLPFTNEYSYNGFLFRVKKYLNSIQNNNFNIYLGIYGGNLNRKIKSAGFADRTGFIGIPSRDFSASSVRGGASLGGLFPVKNFIIDGSFSLGYGAYTNVSNISTTVPPNGYLDLQIWFSLGYRL